MEVIRLANALGAEIREVNISRRLSELEIESIRLIWQEHHVIVFRDVAWSPDQQLEFACRFGTLEKHAATLDDRLDGYPELLEVSTISKNGKRSPTGTAGRDWHSDYANTS